MVAERLVGPPSKRLKPPSARCRRRRYRTIFCSRSRLTRSSRWLSSNSSALIVVSASSLPTQKPSGDRRAKTLARARAMASFRPVTIGDGNMRVHYRKMDLLVATVLLRPYVFAFLAAFLAAATVDLGVRRTALFATCLWPLAWLAEFASTRIGIPFGLYHYTGSTRGQELYVANVPFMDSLSFVFLAYAAFCLARATLRVRPRSRWALAT